MVDHEIEREIKLEAPPEPTPVPDLTGLPSVAEVRTTRCTLEAAYHDTPDLALAAAGITLRRRTGGADEGWHLKRPAQDARTETRLPLGPAEAPVPEELLTYVRAVVRDRPLVQVATVVNERHVHELLDTDGSVLAEVCDDHVRGAAHVGPRAPEAGTAGEGPAMDTAAGGDGVLVWREWEVELRGGDPDLLDAASALLQAAGAAPASSASKLQHVLGLDREADRPQGAGESGGLSDAGAGAVVRDHLAAQVAELTARDPQVRTDEPDGVHKMRVATRRLRSALTTFRPLLDRRVTDPLRSDLQDLGAVLGAARDAEVMRDRLRESVSRLDEELVMGPVVRRLGLDLDDRYHEARRRALEVLDGADYLRLLDALDQLVTHPPWTSKAQADDGDVLLKPIRRAYRELRAAVDDAADLPPGDRRDAHLHECRKAAKRARYAAEAVVPRYGRPAERFAAAMERVQEALGEHHDSAVARETVREIGVRSHLDGETAFTWGLLHGIEEQRGREADDAFQRAWTKASRKKLRRWLRT